MRNLSLLTAFGMVCGFVFFIGFTLGGVFVMDVGHRCFPSSEEAATHG